MMRLFNKVALAPILLLLVSQVTFAQFQYPRSGGALNDFAGKLTPTTRQRLETNVTEFQRRSGIDLRVVTIPQSDLRGRSIEQYSIGLARLWAVGRNSGSRGLLLLVAIGSPDKHGIYHGTTRLEVSRNLEPDIPNNLAGELTSRMRESLMAGWFDEALTIGVDGVVSAIDQKQRETSQNNARSQTPLSSSPRSPNLPEGALASSRSTPDMFGFVIVLLVLGVPAIIIAAIIRGIARNSGPGYYAGRSKWAGRRGGIGVGTGIALSGTDWSSQGSSTNMSVDSDTATWVDSTSTSSWTDSSSSSVSDSSSSSSDSSSSSSDSSSSSSSGGDFGGGGSTDSW